MYEIVKNKEKALFYKEEISKRLRPRRLRCLLNRDVLGKNACV